MAARERMEADYHAGYHYEEPDGICLTRQRETHWESPITFSILVPAYETKAEYLCCLLDSMLAQTYPYWELILADAGKSDGVRKVTAGYGEKRIRYVKLTENAGISENTNRALELATGDYVGLLDHDDWLTPDALFEMASMIRKGKEENREYMLVYSDEDKSDEDGKDFYEPHFKTDFNLDLFLSNNYICHFLVMKRELMQRLTLRAGFDGAQDYDLCLRAVSEAMKEGLMPEEVMGHVPKILYHWRCHRDSTAANPASKAYAYEAGKRAVEAFLEEHNWKASVSHMSHLGFYRVSYEGGVFAQRTDVAAVGGKVVRKGRVAAGLFNEAGEALYEGLPAGYSGYMHRAVLPQSAAELCMESWKVNPNCKDTLETIRKEVEEEAGAATRAELQSRICKRIRGMGYRLYWDPEWIVKQ